MILFCIFAGWRVVLFLWSFFIAKYTVFTPSFPYSESILSGTGFPRWIWSFANFDGVHYVNIARSGYFAQYSQAFFPLYPLLASHIGRILGEDGKLMSGLIISAISFYIAIILLVKLLNIDSTISRKIHHRQKNLTIWFLLIFPTSFYFSAYYTESLFLLLSLFSVYLARKKRWIWSGIIAAFASATKITGIVLVFPLLYEWYITYHTQSYKSIFRNLNASLIVLLKSPVLYLAPIGIVSYMIFLQLRYHDALYFWHAQSAFGAERSGDSIIFPLQTLYRYLKILKNVDFSSHTFFVASLELGATIFAAVALFLGHRLKIRKSYLWYGWVLLLIPMFSGTLSSMPRYILMIFPIYIVLGNLKNNFFVVLLSIVSICLLFYTSSFFLRGIWIS